MFIDFVDVENIAHQYGVPNNFYINTINKHVNLDKHFGIIKIFLFLLYVLSYLYLYYSFWGRIIILGQRKYMDFSWSWYLDYGP
jgi:hypothetical protein